MEESHELQSPVTQEKEKEKKRKLINPVIPRPKLTRDDLVLRFRCDVSELRKILLVAQEYQHVVNWCFNEKMLYIQAPYEGNVCIANFLLKKERFREFYLDSRLHSLVIALNVKEMFDTCKKGVSNCQVVAYMKAATDDVFHIEFHNVNDCTYTDTEYAIRTCDTALLNISARNFDISMPLPTSKFKDAIDQVNTTGADRIFIQLDYRGIVLYVEESLKVRRLEKYIPWISGASSGEGIRKRGFKYVGYFLTCILSSFAKLAQCVAEQTHFQVKGPVLNGSPLFIQFNINLGTITFVSAQSQYDAKIDELDEKLQLPKSVIEELNIIPTKTTMNDIEVPNYTKHHEAVLNWEEDRDGINAIEDELVEGENAFASTAPEIPALAIAPEIEVAFGETIDEDIAACDGMNAGNNGDDDDDDGRNNNNDYGEEPADGGGGCEDDGGGDD